jgi:glyoxylase-like metal-dependent hydrolase (beta-lactamase superfamily II)
VLDYDISSGKVSTTSADLVVNFIREKNLKLEWMLETHIHADHLTAANYLKEKLDRSHGSLKNLTPFEKYQELKNLIPDIAEIHANYDKTKESFAIWNYKDDQALKAAFKYRDTAFGNKKL